ncbi:MAG: hypothetical protein GQ574_14580 [Crocinitomix sp.]|nr:hypothetical protein [Crocinitomix sp.]
MAQQAVFGLGVRVATKAGITLKATATSRIYTMADGRPCILLDDGFAINEKVLLAGSFTDVPQDIADAWGASPSPEQWAAIGIADPLVEVPLPGEVWMLSSLAILGVPTEIYALGEDDELTEVQM